MAILTGRLEALAEQIKPGETMADIGTDHGFLPITLFQRGTCPKVIMTDVSEKALARAREHGEGVLGLSNDDYRLGDGLAPINLGEVDVVVIAGMGGILMADIMSSDLPKARTIPKYIFQPRNHPEVLRRWLFQNDFSILNECLVRERRNLCEIIVASPFLVNDSLDICSGVMTEIESEIRNEDSWPEGDIQWEIPPWYAKLPDPLAKEYLHKKLERELRVQREVQKGQAPNPERLKQQGIRIGYLRDLCEKRESNDCL
jgi:tRNA (adenine22-N1)-methyltransferase